MNKFFKLVGVLLLLVYSLNSIAPKVSLITSAFDPDNEFIGEFLKDITRQDFFNEACELILINPHCVGLDENIINEYVKNFPNIVYVKLPYDPGVYGVWNMGIKIARGEYVANANLDDRRNPESLKNQSQALDENPDVDLVYSDYLITYNPNETFENNNYRWVVSGPEFSAPNMHLCLPGPQPLWRKSMHEKYGYFDDTFFSSADWKMWLQAVSKGAVFKKVHGLSGLYYLNPKGVSTDSESEKGARRNWENDQIIQQYRYLWQ